MVSRKVFIQSQDVRRVSSLDLPWIASVKKRKDRKGDEEGDQRKWIGVLTVELPFPEWISLRAGLPQYFLLTNISLFRPIFCLLPCLFLGLLSLLLSLQSAPPALPPLTAGKLRPVAALSSETPARKQLEPAPPPTNPCNLQAATHHQWPL